MRMSKITTTAALTIATLAAAASAPALAQGGVTVPPSGANQKASVTQHMGLVTVTIDYSSPDVTAPNGEDRTGKIWGQLVPYGLTNLGFGPATEAPWRAGANENTVFTVSHDVEVEGKPLPAGRYGLHMIAGEDEWTVVFSNNSTSWGSFFYDPAEDALRVTVKPEKHDYTHWLNYTFTDRQLDRATAALQWENLAVPFEISVPDMTDLYLANMRNELRSSAGFTWQGWNGAVQYCLQNNTNLEEALQWADNAISLPFVGQENFQTLSTKAAVLHALGRDGEAGEILTKAIDHPAATSLQIHRAARQILAQGNKELAMKVFRKNAERFPDTWPTDFGLARGYSALGQYDQALKHAKIAHERAPNQPNKDALANFITMLEDGKDFN